MPIFLARGELYGICSSSKELRFLILLYKKGKERERQRERKIRGKKPTTKKQMTATSPPKLKKGYTALPRPDFQSVGLH